jgi:hypothetical protein
MSSVSHQALLIVGTPQVNYPVYWSASSGYNSTIGGGTSCIVIYPIPIGAGDMLIMFAGQKPTTPGGGGMNTPSGWTLLGSVSDKGGYGATQGNDVGNTNMFAFYREADGTEDGDSFFPTFTDNNIAWVGFQQIVKDGGTWELDFDTSEDATSGDLSVIFSSPPDTTTNDVILIAQAIATNTSSTETFSAPAISQSGATFTPIAEADEVDSPGGNKLGGAIWYTTVSAGSSSGAITFTANIASAAETNGRGAAMVVRVRAV